MFSCKWGLKSSSQKNRHYRLRSIRRTNHFKNWVIFFAIGQGHTQPALLSKLYMWGKKLTVQPQTYARFWVNLQVAVAITRKPANLRMGKGKGGRAGAVARVNPGSTLLALSWLRWGRISAIARRIQVRCNFKVGSVRPIKFSHSQYVARKGPRRAYSSTRMYELRSFFRKTNQSYQYLFLGFLFKWFKYKPFLPDYKVSVTELPEELDPFFISNRLTTKLHLFFFWDDADEFTDLFFEQILFNPYTDIHSSDFGGSFTEWYFLLDPNLADYLEEEGDYYSDEEFSDIEFEPELVGLVGALSNMPKSLYSTYTHESVKFAWEYFVVLYGLNSYTTKLNIFNDML